MKNLEQYKDDLERLIARGLALGIAMEAECSPEGLEKRKKELGEKDLKKELREKVTYFLENLPSFSAEYQAWYSEAKALVRQLLPDRFDDFSSYYEKPKTRKEVTYESYRISDYLLGLRMENRFGEETVGPSAAIRRFRQQLAIVEAVKKRFESSLFDIRQLVQADLFDSELEAAKALVKNGFLRAAGAVAGVVMESHLAQVCQNHAIPIRKKKPTIGDFNNALKEADVIDLPRFRLNQHLGDIRNLCDHKRGADPTEEQVNDLVDGVMKLTKTLF